MLRICDDRELARLRRLRRFSAAGLLMLGIVLGAIGTVGAPALAPLPDAWSGDLPELRQLPDVEPSPWCQPETRGALRMDCRLSIPGPADI